MASRRRQGSTAAKEETRGMQSSYSSSSCSKLRDSEYRDAAESERRFRDVTKMRRESFPRKQNASSSHSSDSWKPRFSAATLSNDWRSREEPMSMYRSRFSNFPSCNFTIQRRNCYDGAAQNPISGRKLDDVEDLRSTLNTLASRKSSNPTPSFIVRRRSTIYPLKTFNNWAKARIIQHAIPDDAEQTVVVMDLGCGRGIDLKKWAHARVHRVYLVEEDELDMKECLHRFTELNSRWPGRLKACFVNKDFAFDSIVLPELVDVISCQFFVQRAFNSLEEAETMAKNVARSLKDDGKFIASLVNAEKIKRWLDKFRGETRCTNGVFTVELATPISESSVAEFGTKMLFMIDDKVFPENLVQLETLTNVMKKFGLELVWRRSFLELYEEASRDEEHKPLLINMGVEAQGKLKMSQEQMETADLFEALMFRKILPIPEEVNATAATSACV
ncbi:mRNA cap guanine-N7 methyltransferase-like [Hyalella azteca]|uniref:mRNA (guanine-N(7))-methyltransferase n=1 Tax=Hyalella azteca TaxID=294128 RepID=A0A8B7N236_HYAAZ|nr:mRNA cap guanine-N7 methyltransferase-like [Hyalella azteca]